MQSTPTSQKPIRITRLPIAISENTRLLNGLLRFPTQSFKTDLGTMKGAARMQRNTISMFRPVKEQEEEQEQEKKKREMEVVNIQLKCRRLRNRMFRLQMPVVRGPKSTKTYKSTQMFFTLTFNNYQGTFTLLTGMYDLRNEFIRKNMVTMDEMIRKQRAMTDGRLKENPLGVANLKSEQQQDQ